MICLSTQSIIRINVPLELARVNDSSFALISHLYYPWRSRDRFAKIPGQDDAWK